MTAGLTRDRTTGWIAERQELDATWTPLCPPGEWRAAKRAYRRSKVADPNAEARVRLVTA